MTDHTWLEMAAPFALDALSPEDRRAFEAHLAECAICKQEVRAHREITGLIAHATKPATPPADLRRRVLKGTEQTRPVRVERGKRLPPGWLAAAALLVVAAGLGWLAWSGRAARLDAERSLAEARSAIASRDSLLDALLSPDVVTAELTAADAQPSIRLFWNRVQGVVVLAAFQLPTAPAGRVYQLWGIPADGTPVSVGTFNTSPEGETTARFNIDPNANFALSAVTEEPAGGSPQPTTTPFLVGEWQVNGQ